MSQVSEHYNTINPTIEEPEAGENILNKKCIRLTVLTVISVLTILAVLIDFTEKVLVDKYSASGVVRSIVISKTHKCLFSYYKICCHEVYFYYI